jgi:hypothetical protein
MKNNLNHNSPSKYLGINLTNEAKDDYNKNYKTLKKEIEDTGRHTFYVHKLAKLIL